MAQVIVPILPNAGLLNEAMAGAQSVTFTATDRQIIKDITGEDEIDRNRSFSELFFKRELTPKVENEETTVKPEQDVKALEGRWREHRSMLKHSSIAVPREHVEISEEIPEKVIISPTVEEPTTQKTVGGEKVELHKETAAIAEELNLNPADIIGKFALEQKELHVLICRIKELHLKRLLCSDQKEFDRLTETIRKETLAAGRAEARPWLESQLDQLTQSAAEYKLNLQESLQSMGLNKS